MQIIAYGILKAGNVSMPTMPTIKIGQKGSPKMSLRQRNKLHPNTALRKLLALLK